MIIPSKKLIDLVEGMVKREPAGIELKPYKVFELPIKEFDYVLIEKDKRGFVKDNKFFSYKEVLKEVKPINNYWQLKGYYYVVFPKVKIPKDAIALAFPRSTFNRLGILKYPTAVFDPGYEGQFNQTFYFPIKTKIHIDEWWLQLVFIRLEENPDFQYKGFFQNEKY